MKAIVLSDSHGSENLMEEAIIKEKPQMAIFLGDGYKDFENIKNIVAYDCITLQVAGNCDFGCEYLPSFVDIIEGVVTYITHGTREHVKQGLDGIYDSAYANGAKLALYGHTHCQDKEVISDITFINPGAIEDGYYAIIDFRNNKFEVELKRL